MPSGPHLSLAVDMLSDPSYNTLPLDMPTFLDPHPEEDLTPLNFDDLLDIAREFEFTRTIAHVWPYEEEPFTFPETGLEDLLAAITPTPNAEESPLPLSNPTLSMTLDPVCIQDVDLFRSPSMCPSSDTPTRDLVPPLKDDDQVQAKVEPSITSTLQGWSPPNGSQFLDLDDSLMLPQSLRDVWIPPWLAVILTSSCTQPASNTNQFSAMVPAIGDVQPPAPTTELKAPPASTMDRTSDDSIEKSAPLVSLPVQPMALPTPQPVQARAALQANSDTPSQTTSIGRAKTPKSRPQPSSASAASGACIARYAKAPRGGIPPHIARTVTKANILIVEKERKVMQDASSSTPAGEKKKPSVLRRACKTGRESCKALDGSGRGKKSIVCGENEGRLAKKARV